MAANRKRNDLESHATAKPKDSFLWDDHVPQLAARRRGQSHTWIVQTRSDAKTVRTKIGDVSSMPVTIARATALSMLEAASNQAAEHDPEVSLATFAERFLADCQHQWKPSTLKAHGKCVVGQIVPALGRISIAALGREDVLSWRRQMSGAASTKNRALAVLSSMVRHAELLGLRRSGENPCAGLRRHQSDFKADYLDADGFAALHKVLSAQAEAFPRAVPFIRFVMLTGCRSGEAKVACWHQWDKSRITLPDAKAGPKSLWLGKPARDLLKGVPRTGAYIFAGNDEKALSNELTRFWKLVRKQLGRPKLRIHDLRHSFASVAVNLGYDLRIVGGLLGHRDIETTAGYAHLDQVRVAAASERVGRHLGRAFSKPVRKAKPAQPAPDTRSVFAQFVTSKVPLPMFCASHALDPDTFRQDLIVWRAQKGSRA
jgi:integrase